MKICYIADAMSIHTQRWVKYFANRGNEVHLISPTPAGGSDIGRAKLHVLKRFPLNMRVVSFAINLLLYAIQIRKLLRKIKPDILHAHYITDCGFWGALSGFHPFMLSVWGSDVLVDPNKSSIHRSFVRFALKRADLITTTAQYVNQYLQQEFNLPSNKVKTILWGIDINTFQKRCPDEGKTLRKKLIIDDGCFTIISPRSMKEPYGIESIVKSIPHIIEKHPNTCFILLAGLAEPAYRDRLKDMVENLDIKEHVRFVPRYLDQREMAAYYNISEVFISIPRTDQFAACIMEGMSCGVIPIVGKLEVYRQYLIDGENALFVDRQNPRDIAEKVIYCIEHPELKDRFYKINGKIIIEEGNWNKNTLRIEKVYLDLLKGNHQR